MRPHAVPPASSSCSYTASTHTRAHLPVHTHTHTHTHISCSATMCTFLAFSSRFQRDSTPSLLSLAHTPDRVNARTEILPFSRAHTHIYLPCSATMGGFLESPHSFAASLPSVLGMLTSVCARAEGGDAFICISGNLRHSEGDAHAHSHAGMGARDVPTNSCSACVYEAAGPR